ncbi:MFS transporter [Haloplanus aerogenes]|uniref:MFS transporter n=1 Tax=Haloplanus aerogenes TaxID=660522 RepID=A0A3M0CVM0_9EURY|nr:MFS transporter [Haloplanus aerogenes]AZH26957.1 MFS transporter [Haloplanus aerogenes]RMB12610.1 putative MFS family arabinose efflux permease [Haloplanus aerogenes]
MTDHVGATATSEERLLGGYGGRLLLLVSLGWLTIQGGRLVLSPLLPSLIDDLAITPFRAGIALSVLWGLYALGQFPSGRLSDRLTRKTLLVAGLTIAAAGFAVLAVAVSYPLFLLGAAVVGVGAGLYPTAARALISDHFEAKRGGAFGLHTASGDLGGGVAAGLAVAALAVATWRAAFLPVVAVLVLVAVVLHATSRESYHVAAVDLDVRATVGRLFATARTRRLLFAYCLFAFAWQGTAGFLPTLLQLDKGFSPEFASAGFAGLFVVGALVKPTAGRLADRVRRAPVAAGTLALGAVALVGLLAAETPLAVGVATVVFATGLMAFPPVMQSYLMDVFPTASMGADLGLARTTYIGFGALGPSFIGFVAERTDYTTAFGALAAALLVAAVVVAIEARP